MGLCVMQRLGQWTCAYWRRGRRNKMLANFSFRIAFALSIFDADLFYRRLSPRILMLSIRSIAPLQNARSTHSPHWFVEAVWIRNSQYKEHWIRFRDNTYYLWLFNSNKRRKKKPEIIIQLASLLWNRLTVMNWQIWIHNSRRHCGGTYLLVIYVSRKRKIHILKNCVWKFSNAFNWNNGFQLAVCCCVCCWCYTKYAVCCMPIDV